MRIVHVIARMDPGGAERVVLHLAEQSVGRHQLTVVSGGGSWVGRLRERGVDHVEIPGTAPGAAPPLFGTARTVRRVVRSVRPHIVHTTNVRVTVGAAVGVRLSGHRPAVLTVAQGTAPTEMARAARILRRTSPIVVGCAPAVTEDLAAAGFPRDRLRTIDNAAAFDPATPERVDAAARDLELPADRPLVVGLGRLVPQKNWAVLVEAMRDADDVEVVVAGEGPLRGDLEHLAREVRAPVRFVGYVDDVPALLARARCVVSTSDWEGLPLALLEAMSLGVPVVATSVDGNPDHLGPGAVLVPPREPAETRREVERMITDDDHRRTVAQGAREVATARSPSTMADAYDALYHELAP